EAARDAAVAAVKAGGFGRREVAIRVNGLGTPWGVEDLRAVEEAGPDVVIVPKVSTVDDIEAYGVEVANAPGTQLWAMIETCAAMFHLPAIAASAERTRLS